MIYGTNKQYDELEAWVSENCPQYLDDFIGRDGFLTNRQGQRPIANFDKAGSVWLAANCPLEWVRQNNET
jgi:hypothetical protein